MTYEPTNAELYCVIQRLCGKIENLEKKVDNLNQKRETNIDKIIRSMGLNTPDEYNNWISCIKVENKHYESLFSQQGCIVTTFKDIVLQHMKLCDVIPLYKYKKRIYVYQTADDETEWSLFDNDNFIEMVMRVWQKLLAFQLSVIYDDTEDDDIKDQKRMVVIQMRKNLCDKKCNRESILKWIKEVL